MNRWRKRSKEKRVELLVRACQDIPQTANSMFELTQSNGGQYNWRPSRTPTFRFAALLPYLDVSALKDNPSLIFALMHYRTQYTLEDWATFDMHQFRDPWKSGLLSLEFSPLCVAMYRDH